MEGVRTIACPARHVFSLLREPHKRRRFDSPSDIPGLSTLTADCADHFAQELVDLALLTRDHGRYSINDWTIVRIVEHLDLAGAIQAMAAAQVAGAAGNADFSHLERLNGVLRGMDDRDPANLLAGAYIDYQWHLELVRISGNRAALGAYSRAIPPAVWIAGANFFQLEEARSSLTEHERLVAYMKVGDTLRARDAVALHFEEAASQIRRAGQARIESYP
ncbi:FCD domain-containing protein [Novosphingobium mathurense]|uniref:FCD domain-containing protein n=1 Tax=Novosphingobium mathurense TaxID=428990 RepID=UPI001FE79C27|nr:FCD domain-containing protein [Novosphingobium mathurense]